LKAQKDESATGDKALKEARRALAQALQNGQTSQEQAFTNSTLVAWKLTGGAVLDPGPDKRYIFGVNEQNVA
jgi:hypothetical protein